MTLSKQTLTVEQKKQRSIASLKYYYKNREKRLEQQKIYNQKNHEKYKQYQKDYFLRTKTKINQHLDYDQSLIHKKFREKYEENLRYQKAYYRKTNLDKKTWKVDDSTIIRNNSCTVTFHDF